ncbi:hypothetical protein [Dyadobacter sp. 676]|uniref:Uncharacterized protein n=1 Tax=Dyadobacter sp. 676 TaxID=3088362 RepID=A0AAU8FLT8_9BACT
METGAIKAAHIYSCGNMFLTAALEINVKGVNFFFGGHEIFHTGARGGRTGDVPYLGKFVFRCLEVCGVQAWSQLKNCKVLVKIVNRHAVAIGQLRGNKIFNPAEEFGAARNNGKEGIDMPDIIG